MNQRWNHRHTSYRRPDEVITPAHYDVAALDEPTAKRFILTHHYSGSYPAARVRLGLYKGGRLVGVAVFSHPMNDRAVTGVFGCQATEALELGRFVLLDEIPGNGETWFLARAFAVLRASGCHGQEIRGVVSFSDPWRRTDQNGHIVHRGHIGTIYQAHNGIYLGQTERRTIRLLPDGALLSPRAMQKIRAREQGFDYASNLLIQHGADAVWDNSTAWLNHWIERLTRKERHPGMHKYAWGLIKQTRRQLPESLPFPKVKI